MEYLLSFELKKSSQCFKVEHESNTLKVDEIQVVFELSVKPLDSAHMFYSLFLFSAYDTWFPVWLFPPFVHRYFLLTIHHSEKGMSLNRQLVLCSDKIYHSSFSRLYVRNPEINTIFGLLEMSWFDKWYFRKYNNKHWKTESYIPKCINIEHKLIWYCFKNLKGLFSDMIPMCICYKTFNI